MHAGVDSGVNDNTHSHIKYFFVQSDWFLQRISTMFITHTFFVQIQPEGVFKIMISYTFAVVHQSEGVLEF